MSDIITKRHGRVRIAAVGDIHVTRKGGGHFQSLFVQMSQDADIILLCGDLTDYGLPEEAHVLAQELKAAATVPLVGVLGNHDFEAGKPTEVHDILCREGEVTMLDGDSCEILGVGFAGVILVTRPGFGGIHPAALLSVASLCCYAFYIISTRVLSRTDSSETTLFYSNLFGAVVMTMVVPFVWTTPDRWLHVALMLGMGALGSTGHYLLIIAHRVAPPVVLAPFMYTQLIWVIALGFLIFGDLPNQWTLAGAATVVASGLYLLHRERRVGKAVTATGAAIE